jgi:DNA-binding transcriptional MerR regulator
MGFFIQNYQGFSGSAADLADLAITCSRNLRLPGDISKISERLIRYYVTEGLLSRPMRIGREADYHYKHLLQFLASRSLMEEGYPMQKVADYIAGLEQLQLEPLALGQTKPNLAELLVASFKHPEKIARTLRTQKRFTPGNTVDSIPMMSMSSVGARLDKTQKGSRSNLGSESYLEGMKKTGVVNTRELVGDLRLEVTELKTMVSEIFNNLASIAQPAIVKVSGDAQEKFHEDIQRIRNSLDSFCQKMDSSMHMFMEKQTDIVKHLTDMHHDMAHRQEMHIRQLEEMIKKLSK